MSTESAIRLLAGSLSPVSLALTQPLSAPKPSGEGA
jgi:hypothetical protein